MKGKERSACIYEAARLRPGGVGIPMIAVTGMAIFPQPRSGIKKRERVPMACTIWQGMCGSGWRIGMIKRQGKMASLFFSCCTE